MILNIFPQNKDMNQNVKLEAVHQVMPRSCASDWLKNPYKLPATNTENKVLRQTVALRPTSVLAIASIVKRWGGKRRGLIF